MKNIGLISISIFLLIGTVLFAAGNFSIAHGSPAGTVCIIPAGASSCSSSPASITGTVGTQLRVSVFIQNSTGLNGFDVTLSASHTILKPAGADLKGSVLPGPQTVLLECLSGVLVSGPTCSATDTIDTLHFAAGSSPGTITGTPTTGLLFTAIYNITSSTSGTSLGFQTGCGSSTAPTSDPPVCITIANGSINAVPETTQSAIFSTSTVPGFVLSANPSGVTITAGSSATLGLSITSINSFSGIVSLTTTVSPPGPAITLNPSTVTLAANQTLTSILTVSSTTSTPTGTYAVTIAGTSGSLVNTVNITVDVNSPPQPGFTIAASPSSLSVMVGSSGSSTISVSSTNGFAGSVSLTASISKPGLAVSFSPVNLTLSSGGTGSSTMIVSTTSSTAAGSYSLLVVGRSVTGAFNTASVQVIVPTQPDFTVTASPSSLTITGGSSGASTVTLSSLNGFAGTINLAATISPAGPAISLSASSITLSAGQSGAFSMTVSTFSSTASGPYTVTVSGVSGTISHSITIPVTIFGTQPDFTITASPSSLIVAAGIPGTSTITIGPVNGFNSSVVLTITTSSGLAGAVSPSTVGPNGQATLTVTAPVAGSYTATVTGTSGSLSHSTSVFVTVASTDFTITANPTSLTISTGASGTSSISLHGVNGFNNTVFLAVSTSSGLTGTISPTSTGPFGTAILTVSSNIAGSYTAQVTGTSGSLSHTTIVNVMVTSSGVGIVCIIPSGTTTCSSNPAQITGVPGTQLRVSVFIQNSGALSGFDITLLADHTIMRPAGIDLTGTVLPAPNTIVLECLGGVIVHGPACSGTADTLELAAVGAPSQVTFPPTTGLLFTAVYNVTGTTSGIPVGYRLGCSSTSVSGTTLCVTIANGSTSPVPETAQSAIFSTSTTPDFVMTGSPSSITINAGSSGTSTVSITSTNGFSGTISLNTTVVTGNLTIGISPVSVTVGSGQTATSTVTISASSATTPGTYTASIAGLSGSLFHSVAISVTVNASPTHDFSITSSPSSISIAQGSSATTTATLTSLNGFTGTVTLTVSAPVGLTGGLTPATITLSSGSTGTSVLTLSTMSSTGIGTYTVTLTGSSNSLSHSSIIMVTVTGSASGDFTITESPTFQAIPVASERQTIITVTSVNGFSGNVNLVITPSSTAFACWFTTLTNTATVFVPAGGSANQFPTCAAGRPAGTYNATIAGTSGSLSHAIILGVTVTDFSVTASSISFASGSSGTSTVTLTSLFGLSGTIGLSVSTPSGLTGTCPSSVTLSSGGTSTSSCTFSSTTPGTYGATFTGTFVCSDCYFNGNDIRSANITVTVSGAGVPDFSISASPSSLTLASGSSGTSTISIAAINGFSSIVSLTVSHPNGIGAIVSPTSITGSGTATLTIGTNMTGTFSVQVTGSSGTLSHSVSITVTVANLGVVCMISSGNNSCPISPASLTAPVGSQLRVLIFIQGSAGLDGFDVTLLADHTVLHPIGVDLTGTVLLGTPTIILECLQGVLIQGSICSSTDTINTLQLVATSAPGSGITATPTTGLMFTAIYNVTGTTPGISLGFQTGCNNTSVNGGVCVTIANGTPIPVPEAVQTATFSNIAPSPDFSVTASPSSFTTPAGSCTTSTVTLASINGFSGTITLTTSVSPNGPTATLSSTTVFITSGGSAITALTVCTTASTAPGSYAVTVTATSGSISHATTVVAIVTATPNFTITATPSSQTIKKGASAIFTITITGTNSFNGTVQLTTTISPMVRNGPNISLPSAVGPYSNSTLTVSTARSTPIGTYIITVTATSGSITHTVTIKVIVTK